MVQNCNRLFGLSSMCTVEGDFFCQSFWNCTNMDYYRGQQCDRVSRGSSHHVLSATILPSTEGEIFFRGNMMTINHNVARN